MASAPGCCIAAAALGNLAHALNHAYDALISRAPLSYWLADTALLLLALVMLLVWAGLVFGGKITGGGSGGTVVMLGERGKVWYEALRIKKALLEHTGHSAHIFRWSSPGAVVFGGIELRPSGA